MLLFIRLFICTILSFQVTACCHQRDLQEEIVCSYTANEEEFQKCLDYMDVDNYLSLIRDSVRRQYPDSKNKAIYGISGVYYGIVEKTYKWLRGLDKDVADYLLVISDLGDVVEVYLIRRVEGAIPEKVEEQIGYEEDYILEFDGHKGDLIRSHIQK